MKAATTLPRLLHRNAARFATRPALREKRGGIWQVLNWSDYAVLVSRLAAGLAAHGFNRGGEAEGDGDREWDGEDDEEGRGSEGLPEIWIVQGFGVVVGADPFGWFRGDDFVVHEGDGEAVEERKD